MRSIQRGPEKKGLLKQKGCNESKKGQNLKDEGSKARCQRQHYKLYISVRLNEKIEGQDLRMA